MNDIEQYEFDRLGYLVIPNFLTDAEVTSLSAAIDAAEEDALAQVGSPAGQNKRHMGSNTAIMPKRAISSAARAKKAIHPDHRRFL